MTLYETDRLIVREWTRQPADLARVFDTYSRWEVARWLGAQPRAMDDPAQAAASVDRWRAHYADSGGRYGCWAIEVRETGTVAGSVLLKPLPNSDGSTPTDIEVGWHLHPDSWGNGYASEAARGAIAREFDAGTEEIFAVVNPDNDRSLAVCRRLGMSALGLTDRWYGMTLESFRIAGSGAA